jgi:hypothetical protein
VFNTTVGLLRTLVAGVAEELTASALAGWSELRFNDL